MDVLMDGCVYPHPHTCVLWLKFLDRLDKPVHLNQTHELRLTERHEKERNEDRQHDISIQWLQLELGALNVYAGSICTWHKNMTVYMSIRLNGGREFLSHIKSSSSISPGTRVSVCVSRVGLLICKNTLPSAPPTQLTLGVWLVYVSYSFTKKHIHTLTAIWAIQDNYAFLKFKSWFKPFFFFNQRNHNFDKTAK